MKDKAGVVVYVGKAANLRSRLRSYFARSGDDRFFVRLLDHVLGDIEVVVTRSATEALLLEDQLIKTHQPRFNVKLKDDKNFLNLRLDTRHAFPRLDVVRRRKKDGARYFGPYPSASAIRSTLRLVNRHFQLRTCRDTEFANRSRPCLEHQIKRCPAPCVLEVPTEEYGESVRNVTLFLDGRGDELATNLRARMQLAAEAMDFEHAAALRDQAAAVSRTLEQQSVVMAGLNDLDVFGTAREGPYAAVHVQRVRNGRIQHAQAFKLGRNEAPDDVLVTQFLDRYYGRGEEIPPEVLLPVVIEDPEVIGAWLSEKRGTRVRLKVPQRGERRRLVEGANRNAASTLRLDQDRADRSREVLAELQKRLRLPRFPERIECFDISNISGTNPVASMVVFTDGEPDKGEYRHFHIRVKDTPDDFAMMTEALSRRFARSKSGEWEAPDLLVVDGGKGQLKMATTVLKELGVPDVPAVGLAKSRLINDDPNAEPEYSAERVFVPGIKDPIILRQNSAPLYLLARLRDEAHRFAITFHRKTRRTKRLGSALDQIDGIGPTRRKRLLTHFGSFARVREATVQDLMHVKGINRELAERIEACT
ncbi:MAG: excinuclease ABC subunit C [Myxococcota bacterium]|jgi:excinuclease ABC subunit C